MKPADLFANDYFHARQKFLDACGDATLSVQTHLHPSAKGPGGEDLFLDVTEIGNHHAASAIVLVSATHGVEGFCGSACQTGIIKHLRDQVDDKSVRLVFVHALNPYGFAWERRVNEGNIDLNRNFVNFAEDLPDNKGYEMLREALVPTDLEHQSLKAARRRISEYARTHGYDKLQAAITSGQYTDPQGLYYGGQQSSWSNNIYRDVLRDVVKSSSRMALIDFHTGLGPHGYGEIITEYSDTDDDFLRAKEWFGDDVTSTVSGSSSSAKLSGTTDHAFHQEAGSTEATAFALEFGTVSGDDVFEATRADNWIHAFGDPKSPQGRDVQQAMRDAFYPETDEWKSMVWDRAEDVFRQLVEALS